MSHHQVEQAEQRGDERERDHQAAKEKLQLHQQKPCGFAIERTSAIIPFCRSVRAIESQRWSIALFIASTSSSAPSSSPFALTSLMSWISSAERSRYPAMRRCWFSI